MLRGKLIAVALSAFLTASMAPAVALAGSLAASVPDEGSSPLIATQASAQKMKVITGINVKNSGGVTVESYELDYSSKGLIKKRTFPRGDMTDVISYGYDKKGNVVKLKTKGTSYYSTSIAITRNKAGLPTKETRTATDGYSNTKHTYKISNKVSKGRMVSYTSYEYLQKEGEKAKLVSSTPHKGTVTYNKGRTATHKVAQGKMFIKYAYAYDAKGNMKKVVATYNGDSSKTTATIKNTYKKNLLAKRVITVSNNKYFKNTVTYSYKTVKVPATMVEKAKAQQWALLNNNENFTIDSDRQGFGLYGFPGIIETVPWG